MKRLKTGVMWLAVAVLVCAGGYCAYKYYSEAVLPEKRIAEADEVQRELFGRIKPHCDDTFADESVLHVDTSDNAEDSQDDTKDTNDTGGGSPLAAAEAVNGGTVGWITIPGTYIDYPIARAEDNSFYLQHGFAGDYNYGLGCPFLDCRCESGFSGYDSIVYAHHLTGRRMFADIALYKDESFMESCPEGILTAADGTHRVRFFAYLTVDSGDPCYSVVTEESGKKDYAEHLLDSAVYVRDMTAERLTREGTRLLLLSTCTYETEDTRGVLAGVIE